VIRDKTAIVGLGATPYYKRGTSAPQTLEELVGKSILAAVHDAGLKVQDIDGFAYFAGGFDTALLAETLGIPEVRFSATLTGTGGGSAGAIGLASAAIVSGQADVVVCVGANQQGAQRFGSITAAYPATPENAFFSGRLFNFHHPDLVRIIDFCFNEDLWWSAANTFSQVLRTQLSIQKCYRHVETARLILIQ
jgi:acetyl-CoA acetyltransferase